MDTNNKFMVGATSGGDIVILAPPRHQMPKEDALVFAAWIVSLAGASEGEFADVLEAVQS